MTYEELEEWLKTLTKEQKQTDITIRLVHEDEYYDDISLCVSSGNDVLDEHHPVIEVYL